MLVVNQLAQGFILQESQQTIFIFYIAKTISAIATLSCNLNDNSRI